METFKYSGALIRACIHISEKTSNVGYHTESEFFYTPSANFKCAATRHNVNSCINLKYNYIFVFTSRLYILGKKKIK